MVKRPCRRLLLMDLSCQWAMPPNHHEPEVINFVHSEGDGENAKGKGRSQLASYDAMSSTVVNSQPVYSERNDAGDSLERVPEDEGPLAFGPVLDEAVDGSDMDNEGCGGLTMSRYRRTLRQYLFVPLSSLLLLVLLVALPLTLWPSPLREPPTPLTLISGVILSSALWSLSHLLRIPIYKAISLVCPDTIQDYSSCLSTVVIVLLQEFLRLFSFVILDIHLHPPIHPPPSAPDHESFPDAAFVEAWFLALGWALAEVIAAITQGYEQLFLYADVALPDLDEEDPCFTHTERTPLLSTSRRRSPGVNVKQDISELDAPDDSGTAGQESQFMAADFVADEMVSAVGHEGRRQLNEELDQEVSRLVDLKARVELEDVYGMPFVDIPIFISVLQRVDSVLLSLGITLTLSAAYVRYEAATPPESPSGISKATLLTRTFLLVCLMHILLSLLHTPPILPKIGIHTAAYVGVLVGLGAFFAGLGIWGALI